MTDLILGLGAYDVFASFANYMKRRYKAEAGFFTMNLPKLLEALMQAGVENPIVCANVNKAGFRMSGGIEGYREAASQISGTSYRHVRLRVGRHCAARSDRMGNNEPYVELIVFGASSRGNIENTVCLIRGVCDATHGRSNADRPSQPKIRCAIRCSLGGTQSFASETVVFRR